MIMIGIHFRTIYPNLLPVLGLKNGKCCLIWTNAKSCNLVNRKRNIHIIWIISSLKKSLEKDLGILISNDLKVSQQCQSACTKAMRILGIINRTIVFRHPNIMLRLYNHWLDLILNTVQQRGSLTSAKTKNWSKEFKEDSLAWFPTSRISHMNRDLLKPNYGHERIYVQGPIWLKCKGPGSSVWDLCKGPEVSVW